MAKQLIKDATTEDDKQSLGFFMNKITELTFKSIPDCRKVEELLFKRLTHKHPIIRVKVLRIIKYLCENGRDTFRADLHRAHEAIRENLHFSGPKHPLYGDRQYNAVRAAAKDALDAVFAAPTQHAESLRTRIQGITEQHLSSDSVRGSSGAVNARGGQPSPPRGRPQEPPRHGSAASAAAFASTGVYRGPTSSAPGRRPMPGIGNAAPPKQGYFEKLKGRIDQATAKAVKRADGSSGPPAGYGPPQTGGARTKASSSREQPRERGKVGGSAWGGTTQRYVPVSERKKHQPAGEYRAEGDVSVPENASMGSPAQIAQVSASPVPAAAPETDLLGDVFSSMTIAPGAGASGATAAAPGSFAPAPSTPATFDPLGLDLSAPVASSHAPSAQTSDPVLTDILTASIPVGSMSGAEFLQNVKMRQTAPAPGSYGFPGVSASSSAAPSSASAAAAAPQTSSGGFGFLGLSSPAVEPAHAPVAPAQSTPASGFGFISAEPQQQQAAQPVTASFGFTSAAPAAAASAPSSVSSSSGASPMLFNVRASAAQSHGTGAVGMGMNGQQQQHTDHFAHVGVGGATAPQTVVQPPPKTDDPFSFVMDSFGKK